MQETILKTLEQIEKTNHIRILYAVESGSRAWGFASPDSDYDVRYIYVRTLEDYLRIDQYRDTIEGPLDEVLDFSGWDIRKALLLLKKTNPSLLEWTHSPIIYRTTPAWEELLKSFPQFFNIKKNMLHYLSMCSADLDKIMDGDQVKLKKYLYATRTLLCCRWLEKFASAPPIEFSILCDTMLPDELKATIQELLHRKKYADERGLTDHFPELDAFLCSEATRFRALVPELPETEPTDYAVLNQMFMQVLQDTETQR